MVSVESGERAWWRVSERRLGRRSTGLGEETDGAAPTTTATQPSPAAAAAGQYQSLLTSGQRGGAVVGRRTYDQEVLGKRIVSSHWVTGGAKLCKGNGIVGAYLSDAMVD